MIGAMLAVMLASATPAAQQAPPWDLDYYRIHVRSAAQCMYADGSRSVLLRTENPRMAGFLFVPSDDSSGIMIPVELKRGKLSSFEANGGVTMYHMIIMAVSHLLKIHSEPLAGRDLDAFLARPHPPACSRKSFEADLYDNNE
ncbi:MAG: hypothetical protein GC203_21870 [Phenylobacterium sp.]|uniref:hypothetical protein n=1 Tax=Phenylobacterium sp. TaxID=1871053 RepID=UPI0025F4BB19|nr:hypothetical protein [Phenylobacterium sp.]MBI1200517.1 hypothetical protein [Phenylobacterium sp.]